VVAVEVRNLAQRAASAAGEIKRLIGDSVDSISEGSEQVELAGKTMTDIVNAIQHVTVIMADIAAASIEQNGGITQVHEAITSMDNVTQQNAALVEQAAAAAESLSDQAHNLALEMAHFKIGTKSHGHHGDNAISAE
jgi:methyl-accepting chemotaxis protein